MARISGRNGRVYANLTSGGTAEPIQFITNWTMSQSAEWFEVTAMGDNTKVYVAGLPDASGDMAAVYDTATPGLYSAAIDGVPRKAYLYPDVVNTPAQYFFGTALFDFSIDVGVGGAVTVAGTWAAASSFQKVGWLTGAEIGDEVARTMQAVSSALDESLKVALRPYAAQARATMRAAAGPPTGGDRRFSRMKRYSHGGLLDVTTNTRPGLVFVGSKGPWKIAEEGAAPHGRHPGTARSQGHQAWSRAADPISDRAAEEVPQVIDSAVEGAFGG